MKFLTCPQCDATLSVEENREMLFCSYCGREFLLNDNKNTNSKSDIFYKSKENAGSEASGIVYSNVSNASTHYFDDKLVTPKGHGFAAEQANHLMDLYLGKDAVIVGDDNLKNGADRIVDGIQIQSKYCASGSKCIQECFKDGNFRYWNADGSPMQIEVPSDMYESAVQAMENRIRNGEVKGVTDPAEAKNIVRKGHFTYQQVKNIAKAGTVESITFDAASGAIIALNTFGITAVLSFATALWNGEDFDTALKSAVTSGLKVGGTAFVTAVLAGQLGKAGLNSLLVGSSEAVVKLMGPKASAVLVNAFRSGTNIYGAAAMKSAAKLLRGNVITSAVSFVVLSLGDIGNIFAGRISGKQLFKNLTNTASSVAGGGLGWTAGAAAGAAIGSVIPIVGTAAGGVIGGLLGAFGGGTLASKATGAILNEFIEDDADQMVDIIQKVFSKLAEDYLISQSEAETIVDKMKDKITGKLLKDMYASSDREMFARNLIEDYFVDISKSRKFIALPSSTQMQNGLKAVLEDIADSEDFIEETKHNHSVITEATKATKIPVAKKDNNQLLSEKFEEIFGYKPGQIEYKVMDNALHVICNGRCRSSDVLTVFDTSILSSGKSGIVLTNKGIYVKDSANYTSKFSVSYSDILRTDIRMSGDKKVIVIKAKNGSCYEISVSRMPDNLKRFIDYAIHLR